MALTLVDQFAVDNPSGAARQIELLWGDLTQLSPADRVDVLVVSTLPGDYSPSPGSLVGALAAAGISVADLANDKAATYEPGIPCWISQPISSSNPGIQFGRILVYEPANPATQSWLAAWSIFQALQCFSHTAGAAVGSVAMPLVSTGSGGADPVQILEGLITAGQHWGSSNSFALGTTKIVAFTQNVAQNLEASFSSLKGNYQNVFDLPLPGGYANFVQQAKNVIGGKTLPSTVTYRQALAVCIYTTNYYPQINTVLRSSPPGSPAYEQMLPLFEAIDSGLWNMTFHQGTTIRGENMTPDRRDQYQVGVSITALAYTSSSTRDLGWGTDRLVIAGTTGSEVWSYTASPGEDEVLFHRGLVFRIDARDCPAGCTFNVTDTSPNWCGGG